MMMVDDDDDVLCVCVCVFSCPLFSRLLRMSRVSVCCLLSACLMCADSNSVPVHMGGGSWGSVGKPRGAHKKAGVTYTDKTLIHSDMTHLGEVPISISI